LTRATEVQLVVINKGMERGVIALLTELFERMAAVEQYTREGAAIQLQMATQLGQVVDGAGRIRQEVEKMQRGNRGSDDDDLPPLAS
jgi:hypothetical protein